MIYTAGDLNARSRKGLVRFSNSRSECIYLRTIYILYRKLIAKNNCEKVVNLQ